MIAELLGCVVFDSGSQTNGNGEVCDITKSRLDDSLLEFLPPPFKKQDMVFLHCGLAALKEDCPRPCELSLNWCLGDENFEVVNATTGFVVDW